MKRILIVLIIVISAISCEKIIAEDITGKIPVLIIPSVNDTVQFNPVHFKWQEMEGASKYHLMVVSPSFSSINQYVLDTMVSSTDFFYDLDSNEYEMKLVGVNGGYVSDTLGPIKFWVGVAGTSAGGNVQLLSPQDTTYVNSSFNNQFQWNSLVNASTYEISIRDGEVFSTGTMLEGQNNIATTSYTSSLSFSEGSYSWGVKAYMTGGTETSYTTRVFHVDLTNPNAPSLGAPADFSFMSQGLITFSWNNGSDPGTVHAPVNSFLEISSDAAFSNIISSTSIQGNTTDVNLGAGTYYWRVTNADEAGNIGGTSSVFQLTLN